MTVTDAGTTRPRGRQRPAAQGGPAPDHRPYAVDRQHHSARDAAPRDGAQPLRPRDRSPHRDQAAKASPNVVTVLTGSDLAAEQGSLPTAWAVNPEQKTPDHPSIAVDRVAFAGEIVAIVVARSAAEARDAAELVEVDYEELPAGPRPPRGRRPATVLAHPDLGTNKSAFWQFDSAGAGTGGDVDEAIAEARADGIVIEREYRQQRLIPAFMEPRSVVVRPHRRAVHALVVHPDPAHPAVPAGRGARRPGVQAPGHRPRRGRRLRRQAPDHAGGVHHLPGGPPAGQALQVHRDPVGVADGGPPRPRPDPEHHPGRDQGRHGDRAQGRPDRRPRCVRRASSAAASRSWVPSCSTRSTSSPAYQFNCTNYYTNKTWVDAYRGAGRPEATFAIERIMDELAHELGRDPLEVREQNWIKHEEFPFTTVCRDGLRLRQLRGRHRPGQGAVRVRRAPRRAEAAPRAQATRSSSASASRRSPRCAASPPPGSSARSTTPPAAGSTPTSGCSPTGKVEVVTGVLRPRAGPRDRLVADRRGPPRRAVRRHRGPARRHRRCPRRAWTPTAPARWSSAARP